MIRDLWKTKSHFLWLQEHLMKMWLSRSRDDSYIFANSPHSQAMGKNPEGFHLPVWAALTKKEVYPMENIDFPVKVLVQFQIPRVK